ncbi:MAG: DinB family protein [Geodermatophilaceae bacterium]
MDSIIFREPPVAGDEIELLLGILDRTRSVLAWKCGGLDAAGLRTTLGPSAVTLGGLLKHLSRVEDEVFSVKLYGHDPTPPWDTAEWAWEWGSAAEDTPEELFALWQEAVERSRASVAEALTRGDMGQPVHLTNPPDEHANLRRLVVDMIDEYARHNGQADLIRESVDGLVGEDPPQP